MGLVDKIRFEESFISDGGISPTTETLGGSYIDAKLGKGFDVGDSVSGSLFYAPSDFGLNWNSNVWGITIWALADTASLDTEYATPPNSLNRHNLLNLSSYYTAGETDIRLGFHSSSSGARTITVGTYENQSAKGVPSGRTFTTAQWDRWILHGLFCDGSALYYWTWETENGFQESSSVVNWNSATYPFQDLLIVGGYGWDNNSWRGGIDELRLYDSPISKKEFLELARAKVLHYTFDDFQEPTTNLTYSSGGTGPTLGIDINGRSTKTDLGNGRYLYQSNNTGSFTIRVLCNESDLIDGETYACQVKFEENSGTLGLDWCDVYITGGNTNRNGIMSGTQSRSTYDSTYRFLDINVGNGTSVILSNVQVEHKDYITPFVAGSRGAMIVRDSSGQEADSNSISESITPRWTSNARVGSGAYDFDGEATKYIRAELPSGQRIGDTFTICCWFYKRAHTVAQYPIFLSFGLPYLANGSSNVFRFSYTRDSDAAQTNVSGTTAPALNTWYHVAVTSESGGSVKIFVNGVEEGSSSQSSQNDSSSVFDLGRHYGNDTYRMDGLLDDVRIYSTALSADDIKEIYETRAQIDNEGQLWV